MLTVFDLCLVDLLFDTREISYLGVSRYLPLFVPLFGLGSDVVHAKVSML